MIEAGCERLVRLRSNDRSPLGHPDPAVAGDARGDGDAPRSGDEQSREDPTVLELERRGAELLGQEEAVYLPTATMANQIALLILGERGTELVVEETAHIMVSELGGAAMHGGPADARAARHHGRLSPEQIRATMHEDGSFHTPRTSVVALENTHNNAGGTVWPIDELHAVVATARELGLKLHLDGARLLNASVATGVPARELGAPFDTVSLCLSKGLGCPLGALIAGSNELMLAARREKHRFGGAMRQAGIVAAAGIFALDHNVERLAEDHARRPAARRGVGRARRADRARARTVELRADRRPGTRARRVGGDRAAPRAWGRSSRARCGRACCAPSRIST